MAHTGAYAIEFLRELERKTVAPFERENAQLRLFAGRELEPWDIGYYAEKQRQALYDFDEEELRPYFPADRVVAGMFEIVEKLYGIEVRERAGVPVWHPDVKVYDVFDADATLLGTFYADWFPRETKRGGAWMDAFLTGDPRPHVGTICGNMTAPIGDRPALLTHREVETIFHEFGHLLHHHAERRGSAEFGGYQRGVGFCGTAFADYGELVLGTAGARSIPRGIGRPARRFRTSCTRRCGGPRRFAADEWANAATRVCADGSAVA